MNAERDEYEPMEYGPVHQRFLQLLMDRGCMRPKEAIVTFEEILAHHNHVVDRKQSAVQLQGTLECASASVSRCGMMVSKISTECDPKGGVMLILMNTQTSSGLKQMSLFSETEMEWVKRLLLKLSESEENHIGTLEAINLVHTMNTGKSFAAKHAEVLVKKLREWKWIIDRDGYITLHPRTVWELRPFLKEQLQLDPCYYCNNVVFFKKNQECGKCGCRIHSYCLKKVWKCPKEVEEEDEEGRICGEPWPGVVTAPRGENEN